MKILVVNAGSATIKFKVFENHQQLLSGKIEQFGQKTRCKLENQDGKFQWEIQGFKFLDSAKIILNEIKNYNVDKIVFRVVHGGGIFNQPTLMNDENLKKLEEISSLAPLHNPPVVELIKSFKFLVPNTDIFAVFDTAYYADLEPKVYMYGLPYEWFELYKVRKYGFHGIAHKYLYSELAKIEEKKEKVITCNLGGGASITSILNGKAIDTSMGFTPLEGLMMATRAGDVDDGAIKYIQEKTNFNDEQMDYIENTKSGLLGISGYTDDMRILLDDMNSGNKRAKLAIDMYIYRIQKYIGAFTSSLNGVDSIVISGGVGAGSDIIRKLIFHSLSYLNFKVDDSINDNKIDVETNLKISTENSKPIWIIPCNEELQINNDLLDFLSSQN